MTTEKKYGKTVGVSDPVHAALVQIRVAKEKACNHMITISLNFVIECLLAKYNNQPEPQPHRGYAEKVLETAKKVSEL